MTGIALFAALATTDALAVTPSSNSRSFHMQGYPQYNWTGTGNVPPNVIFLLDSNSSMTSTATAVGINGCTDAGGTQQGDALCRSEIVNALDTNLGYHTWARYGVAFTDHGVFNPNYNPTIFREGFAGLNTADGRSIAWSQLFAVGMQGGERLGDVTSALQSWTGVVWFNSNYRNLSEALAEIYQGYIQGGGSYYDGVSPNDVTCRNTHIIVITNGLPSADDSPAVASLEADMVISALGDDFSALTGDPNVQDMICDEATGDPTFASVDACKYDNVVHYLAQNGVYVHTIYINDNPTDQYNRAIQIPGIAETEQRYATAAWLYEHAGDQVQAAVLAANGGLSYGYNGGTYGMADVVGPDNNTDTLPPFYMRVSTGPQITEAVNVALNWIREYESAPVGGSQTSHVRIGTAGKHVTVSYREDIGMTELNVMGFNNTAPVGRMGLYTLDDDPESSTYGEFEQNLGSPLAEVSDRIETRFATNTAIGTVNPGSAGSATGRNVYTKHVAQESMAALAAVPVGTNPRQSTVDFAMAGAYGSIASAASFPGPDVHPELTGWGTSATNTADALYIGQADNSDEVLNWDFRDLVLAIRGFHSYPFGEWGNVWEAYPSFFSEWFDESDYNNNPADADMNVFTNLGGSTKTIHHLRDFGLSRAAVVDYPEVNDTLSSSSSYNEFLDLLVAEQYPDIAIIPGASGLVHAFLLEDYSALNAGDELWAWAPDTTFSPFSTYGGERLPLLNSADAIPRGVTASVWDAAVRGRTIGFNGNPIVRDIWIDGYDTNPEDGTQDCSGSLASCEWRRVMVLNGGDAGPDVLALDITDPAYPEWLWEFGFTEEYLSTSGRSPGSTVDLEAPLFNAYDVVNDINRPTVWMGSGLPNDPTVMGTPRENGDWNLSTAANQLHASLMQLPIADHAVPSGAAPYSTGAPAAQYVPEGDDMDAVACTTTGLGACIDLGVGVPTVVDADGDGSADLGYVPVRSMLYSSNMEAGDGSYPADGVGSSALVKMCNPDADFDFVEVFDQSDYGDRTAELHYSPTTAFLQDGSLGVYFGTGGPNEHGPWEPGVDQAITRQGGLFFRNDPDPTSCNGFSNGTFFSADALDTTESVTADRLDATRNALLFYIGERLMGKPLVFGGYVFFTTWQPSPGDYVSGGDDHCYYSDGGGVGRLYALEYDTGEPTLDLDGDGTGDGVVEFAGTPSNMVVTDMGTLLVLRNGGGGPAAINANLANGLSQRDKLTTEVGYMQVY